MTNDRKSFSSATYLNEAGDFVSADAVYNPPLLITQFDQSTVGDLARQNNTGWSGKVQLDYLMSADRLLYEAKENGRNKTESAVSATASPKAVKITNASRA